jgi:hypothetical protein
MGGKIPPESLCAAGGEAYYVEGGGQMGVFWRKAACQKGGFFLIFADLSLMKKYILLPCAAPLLPLTFFLKIPIFLGI